MANSSTPFNTTQAAAIYASRGYRPIPIPYRGKNPGITGWQNLRIDADTVLDHFNGEPQNVGILLGSPSGGIIDVDLDCPQAIRLATLFLPPTSAKFGRAGKSHSHYLYLCDPPGETKKFRETREDTEGNRPSLVEYRSSGAQTVFPPSVHECGEPIEFIECNPATFSPATVDPTILLRSVAKVAAGALLTRHWPGKGQRHDLSLALAGVLLNHGWARESALEFIEAVAITAGDNEIRDRLLAVHSTAGKTNGSDRMTGWPRLISIVGKDVADRVEEWLGLNTKGTNSTCPHQDEDESPLPPIISAAELCAHFPEMKPVVIENILRETETANIVAPSKALKSYLAMYIAFCVATKRRILDTFDVVSPGPVLYIDCELHKNTLSKRVRTIGAALGLVSDNYGDSLKFLPMRGHLRDIHQLAPLFHTIQPGQYRLIILDALYRLLPEKCDENSNSDITRLYNRIDQYGEQTGSAILVVHHFPKGIQANKSVTDLGAGASAQSRAVDTHLALRPHEEDHAAVMEAAVRSFAPLQPLCLRWEYPLWRTAPDLSPDDLRMESRRKRKTEEPTEEAWTVERFVGTYLKQQPQTATSIIVAAEAVMSERKANRLLTAAEEAGLIHRWEPTRKNVPIRFATIPQPVTDTGVNP